MRRETRCEGTDCIYRHLSLAVCERANCAYIGQRRERENRQERIEAVLTAVIETKQEATQ